MKRRGFLKFTGLSASAIIIAPSLITENLYASDGGLYKVYEKVQLKDKDGNPLTIKSLKKEENYLFHFPMKSTPCILVDLGERTQKDVTLKADDGTKYIFKGGVGENDSIVAFSAICPHQLTHPTPETSLFQYVSNAGKTLSHDKGGVFVCSSHLSAFNPKEGGKRVSGPATEGLTQIVLEVDKDNTIWAVGVLGPSKFHDYFDAFKDEFKKYYEGRRRAKKLVKHEAKVVSLDSFSKDIIQY